MAPGNANLKGVIKLGRGTRIQVQGLKNQTELNGLTGHLLEFDSVKLRWGVELPDGKKVLLKMGNLLPVGAAVEPAVTADAGPKPAVSPHADQAPGSSDGPRPPTTAEAALTSVDGKGPEMSGAKAVSVTKTAESAANTPARSPHPAFSGKERIEYTAIPPQPSAVEAPAEVESPSPSGKESMESAAPPPQPNGENDEDWPVLPTSAETMKKMQSGCWFENESAAKRFAEQLRANDSALTSICLVPPKRFNDEDVEEICSSLQDNTHCREMLASGHPLSDASCERLAATLQNTSSIETFSVGDSSLGSRARLIFEGLAKNVSVTSLDLEHKGITPDGCQALADALASRQRLTAPACASLALSRNVSAAGFPASALASEAAPPAELLLCDCGVGPSHAGSLGAWAAKGIEYLNLRDNSAFGGEGAERLLAALLPAKVDRVAAPALRRLRLDGCAVGDDGLEAVAEAIGRGLQLEELSVERCEITVVGCEALSRALAGRRLHALSARANVIGDEGCALLGRCAERLDISSTNLSGQMLLTMEEHDLVSLEVFSNPALGPSVSTWFSALNSSKWQRLESLDLSACSLKDEGFMCVCEALLARLDLMPALASLCIGANDVNDTEEKCELIERLGAARGGLLKVLWLDG